MSYTVNLSNSDYDEIRTAVSIELTADVLPNAIIDYSLYKGEAEYRIDKATVNFTNAQKESSAAELKRAAMFLIAAQLAPRVRFIIRETLEGDDIHWQNQDMSKIAAALTANAMAILSHLELLYLKAGRGAIEAFCTGGVSDRRRGGDDRTRRTGSGWGF